MGLARRIGRGAGVVALLALLWPMGCGRKDAARSLEGVPIVRVRLLQDQHLVTLTASRPPTVFPDSAFSRKLDLPKNAGVPVRLTVEGWRVGDEMVGGESVAGGELTLQGDGD